MMSEERCCDALPYAQWCGACHARDGTPLTGRQRAEEPAKVSSRDLLWSRLTARKVFAGDAQNQTYAEILEGVIAVVGVATIAREVRVSPATVRKWASGEVKISRMARKFIPPVLADLLSAAPAGAVGPKRGRPKAARPLALNTQRRIAQ